MYKKLLYLSSEVGLRAFSTLLLGVLKLSWSTLFAIYAFIAVLSTILMIFVQKLPESREIPTTSDTSFEESDLETALLDHLQKFMIELGNGFCFEARQKRLLIGENYYFIDLVFYHRILKCHVLIELKIGAFDHGDIGQLNTYLNYVKQEIAEPSDNAPIGILLVAEKDNALVRYATAGLDENLFVQQYMLQLPKIQQLKEYLENELKYFEK